MWRSKRPDGISDHFLMKSKERRNYRKKQEKENPQIGVKTKITGKIKEEKNRIPPPPKKQLKRGG